MEAENEEDPFASIIKFCQPTASQEAKFPICLLARESEYFADSSRLSSSPDPTPSEPTGIVMVSPPASYGSANGHVEDEASFHTPPEHHAQSHLSSSEDQNLNKLCAEVDGPDRINKVRVIERALDDEPEAKKIRVTEEMLEGDTVPVGETEVIILDSEDSGDEIAAVNLAEDSLDIAREGGADDVVREIGGLMKDGKPKVDAVDGNHELRGKCKSAGASVRRGEKANEISVSSESLDSDSIEEEIDKLKCIVGDGCMEVTQKSGVDGSKKVLTKDARTPEDGKRIAEIGLKTDDGKRIAEIGLKTDDGKRIEEIGLKPDDGKRIEEIGLIPDDGKKIEKNGQKTDGKRIEEIEKFRYAGEVDSRWKGRTGRAGGDSGRRRQLPVSLKGKEKDVGGAGVVETVEKKNGLLDFLDVLKAVVGDTVDDCEDVDFLETAKRRGLVFPKARWWASEDDEE